MEMTLPAEKGQHLSLREDPVSDRAARAERRRGGANDMGDANDLQQHQVAQDLPLLVIRFFRRPEVGKVDWPADSRE